MEPCGGCNFHSFPYKAELPVKVDGEYPTKTFTCKEDVLDVIQLIIEETKEMNLNRNKNFDINKSVKSQLPFFACSNLLYDKEYQRDIQRYIYCETFGIQPYNGAYGDQPSRWTQKSFIIKKALANIQNKARKDGK